MRKIFIKRFMVWIAMPIILSEHALSQTFCFGSGNVIIYSNYDGGYLNINVDQNIPDLKVGITTYEKCEVTLSGPYVGNISQVIYAGYNANNNHCNPSPPTTSINGVSSSLTSILLYPPATWQNSSGYNNGIICNYSCDSVNYQGGCNTPDQIAHYYLTQFGGSLYYHFTQYGCWQATYDVSDGGNCCIGAEIIPPQFSINAGFSVPNDTLCEKDTLFLSNTSYNTFPGATHYLWDFGDGTTDTTLNPFHIYNLDGTFIITLIASNDAGTASDTTTLQMTILDCLTGFGLFDESPIYFFPNPTNGIIHLHTSGASVLEIVSIDGKKMLSKSDSKDSLRQVDLANLPSGIYFLNMEIKGIRTWAKLVKE